MSRVNSKILAVAVAVGLGVLLAAGTCEAGQADMRLGAFSANWCGFSAIIRLEKQVPNRFKGVVRSFEGTIEITKTGQVDSFTLKQMKDGSLHMVRDLSGSRSGQSQVMQTHPPEILSLNNGKLRASFPAKRTEGYGAKLLGFVHMTVK